MIVMPQAFDSVIAVDDELEFGAQRSLRLADAERIASVRLDGAAEGSLKEALATSIPALQPYSVRLLDRIEEIRRLTETVTPLRSFHAVPSSLLGWEDAVPPAHAMPNAGGEAAPEVHDQFADIAPVVDPSTAWEQAWTAWREHGDGAVQSPQTVQEVPVGADLHADADAMIASAPVAHADDQPMESRNVILMPVAGGEACGHVDAVAFEDFRAQAVAPIVTAYAENAKLAAEATAASHALHNLKLFLTDKMAEEATDLFGPERDAPNDPADKVDVVAVDETHTSDFQSAALQQFVHDADRVEETIAGTFADIEPLASIASALTPVPESPKGPPPLPSVTFISVSADLPSAPPAAPQPMVPLHAEGAVPAPRDERIDKRPSPQIAIVPPAPPAPDRMAGAPVVVEATPAREAAKAGTRNASAPKANTPKANVAQAGSPPKAGRRTQAAPKLMRSQRSDAPRTPLDVGGFMAGFALSGAIGVVLYFVMTAS